MKVQGRDGIKKGHELPLVEEKKSHLMEEETVSKSKSTFVSSQKSLKIRSITPNKA